MSWQYACHSAKERSKWMVSFDIRLSQYCATSSSVKNNINKKLYVKNKKKKGLWYRKREKITFLPSILGKQIFNIRFQIDFHRKINSVWWGNFFLRETKPVLGWLKLKSVCQESKWTTPFKIPTIVQRFSLTMSRVPDFNLLTQAANCLNLILL